MSWEDRLLEGMESADKIQGGLDDYYDKMIQDYIRENPQDIPKQAVQVWDDLPGGRPAPLNPNQYPSREDLDALRHYYGPQALAEKAGALPGILAPLWHELGGYFSAATRMNPETFEQTNIDMQNNFKAIYDEYFKDDVPSAVQFGEELDMGTISPKRFEEFSSSALSRVKIPPKMKGEGY